MRFGLFFISLIFTLAAVACGQNPVQTNRHVASAADASTPTSTPLISPIPSPSPVTPPSELTIVVVPVEGKVGETVSMDVVMYNSSNGVAGFAIDAFVVDTDIAQIVDVELPKYGLTRIGDLPAPSVEIAVADLMGLLAGASPQRVIATLNLELKRAGETLVTLRVNAIDDYDGNPLTPNILPGELKATPLTSSP